MNIALGLARRAARHGDIPVGCVIVRGDRIIARGANRRERGKNALWHAELIAISRACRRLSGWRLSGCELYVTLEPCPMCAGALVQARVERLVYGAADPKAGAVNSLYHITTDQRLNHCLAITGGVLAEKCAAILREFFRDRR